MSAAVLALACGVGGGVLAGAPAADAGAGKAKRAPGRKAASVVQVRGWTRGRAVPLARGLGRGVVPARGTKTAAAGPATTTVAPTTTTGPGTPTTTPGTTTSTTGTTAPTTTTTPPTTPAPVLRSGAELTEYAVHLTRATLDAGSIEVTATNYGMDDHNLTPSKNGVVLAQTSTIASHDAATLTADVAPGTYRLYCSLYDHDAQGMHATLTVK